jgi:multiple sugar transport system substrate-binding protein
MRKRGMLLLFVALLLIGTGMLYAGGGQETKKTTVTYFQSIYDGLTEEFPVELQDAFNAANPDIDLKVVPVKWNAMHEKLITSVSGGQPPEVSVIGTRWLLELMSMGVVEEVTNYVSKSTIDNIFPGTMEGKIGGKLMALPIAAGARILAYNTAYASATPNTMEELRELAIKANKPGVYGLIMPGAKHEELTDFVYYFYAAGARFFETKADGSFGKCTVNSPEGVKALTFMNQLANKDKVVQEGFTTMQNREALPTFIAGKAAYVLTGAWVESVAKQNNPSLQMKYGQIPPFAGNKRASLVVTDSIAMFKKTNLKAAGKFLDFFYQDKWRAKFDEQIGFPPVTKTVAQLPQFNTPLYKALGEANVGSVGWPLIDGWAEFNDIIWDANVEVFLGRKTPQQALDDAAAMIDQKRGL